MNYKEVAKIVAESLRKGILSRDEAGELMDEIEFKKRCGNFFEWAKYYMPEKFSAPFCADLHGYLFDIRHEPKTSTMAPRGHAKTTISCVAVPLYIDLNESDDRRYQHFLNIQSTSTKAASLNVSIREIFENNELIRRDYGDMQSDIKWTEKTFITKKGTIYSAIGMGESVRGLNVLNIRPDYVIVDDIYDDDCIEKPERVRKTNSWFFSAIYPAVSSVKDVCFHIRGTAINKEDLYHSLSKNGVYKSRRFQSYNALTETPLWAENKKMTFESLMEKKSEMGSIIFNREYQNEVRSDDDSVIKLKDIKFYDGRQLMTRAQAIHEQSLERLPEISEHVVCTVAGIDVAEKTKEINDFTARVTLHCTNLNNLYIFDATQYKKAFNDSLNDIESHFRRIRADRVWIETNKGEALYTELIRRGVVPVSGKHETKDKLSRLVDQQAKFENGKVYVSMLIPEPIRTELIDQLTTNHPTHDDLRDACLLAMEGARIASSQAIF